MQAARKPASRPEFTWNGVSLALVLGAPLGATCLLYWLWPTEFVLDDGAIVLRYLDNFARGGFFQYNLEDPPVFGLSGFLHGCLAGLLAWSHLLSPENSAFASNIVGAFLTFLALLLILREYTASTLAWISAWLLSVAASNYFLRTAFQALETPLHLGIVLLSVWALISGRGRLFWFLGALSIVSKLDAVPVFCVLGVFRAVSVYAAARTSHTLLSEMRDAALFAGLPLILWGVVMFAVFGSPLPQSAYAKLQVHAHPPGRLSFFAKWWDNDAYRIVVHALVILTFCFRYRRRLLKAASLGPLALLLSATALLALYSYYNPQERMAWYYVLPQTLLLLGAISAVLALVESLKIRTRWTKTALLCVFVGTAYLEGARSLKHAHEAIDYVRKTEPERAAVGRFVSSNAAPDDRLYAGWGYVVREARIYAYDSSSLNSPIVSELKLAGKNTLKELEPDWIVQLPIMPPQVQRNLGYELFGSFYRISLHGRPTWRVYKRVDEAARLTRAVEVTEVSTEGRVFSPRKNMLHIITEAQTRFRALGNGKITGLRFGVVRLRQELQLRIDVEAEGSGEPLSTVTTLIPAEDPSDLVHGETEEVAISIPGGFDSTVLVVVDQDRSGAQESRRIQILDPLWEISAD